MDVRDLAPALLSIGELFDTANALVNDESVKTSVHVRAVEPGCFSIDLQVVQSFWDSTVSILTSKDVTTALTLKGLLIGGAGVSASVGGGLIWLIKKLKGKPIEKAKRIEESMVRISTEEGSLDIPAKLLDLYSDIRVRQATEKVIKPLEKPDIETVAFVENREDIIKIDRENAHYYRSPKIEEKILIEDKRKVAFSIISLTFKEDNKWRLSDGDSQIHATIADRIFLDKVDKNLIRFSKGDILVCEVLYQQKQTADGLKTEHTVEKVIDHIPAKQQLYLDLSITETQDE